MRKTLIATSAAAVIGLAAALMQPKTPEVTQDSALAAVEQGTQTMDELGPAVSSYLLQIDCTIPPTVLPCRDPELAVKLIRQGGHTAVAMHAAMQIAHASTWNQGAGERAVTAVHDSIADLQALTDTPTFRATASPDAVATVAKTHAAVQALAQ